MTSFRNDNTSDSFKNSASSPHTVQPITPRPVLKPVDEKAQPQPADIHMSESGNTGRRPGSRNLAAVLLLLIMMDML